MATVHVTLARVRTRTLNASPIPVIDSATMAAETLTSSGSSQQGANVAPVGSAGAAVWSVTASGGNVWVKFGANPTAASGSGFLVLDGQTRDFGVSTAGEKIAIKDAA